MSMKKRIQKKTGSYAERFSQDSPGSPGAMQRGCKCPTTENNYGRGRSDGEVGEPFFTANPECPLHGFEVLAGLVRERNLH
jgi:hypothetical protein